MPPKWFRAGVLSASRGCWTRRSLEGHLRATCVPSRHQSTLWTSQSDEAVDHVLPNIQDGKRPACDKEVGKDCVTA